MPCKKLERKHRNNVTIIDFSAVTALVFLVLFSEWVWMGSLDDTSG